MIRNPWTHKNVKFFYYAQGALREGLRLLGYRKARKSLLKKLKDLDEEVLRKRLSYYCKINADFAVEASAATLGDLALPEKHRAFYFDLIAHTPYFPDTLKLSYEFGDITQVPPSPALVKSRPIQGDNAHSVLFKLNTVRHFTFTNDRIPYSKKENLLIGRNNVWQEHRRAFLRQYFNHPMCNLGQINAGTSHDQWVKPKISINAHLKHKFIWCQEGHDVASNLKWVMSSNSVAVMPQPKYETWFMEGTLQPNVHYIAVKDDFSDLEERLHYYLDHQDQALEIIQNAHQYVQQFKNAALEKALCLLVLDKYFVKSGQLEPLFSNIY